MGAVSSDNGMSEIYHTSPHQTRSQTHTAVQLALFAPEIVRKHGLSEFHVSPSVSYGKRADGTWGSTFRVSAQDAWQYPEIQLWTENSCPVLLFDCDQGANNPIAAAWAERLPWPSWVCWRRGGGSCHAAYCLQRAVLTRAQDLPVPQAAIARVSEFITQELKADPGYSGFLTHNPVHEQWETEWGHQGGYTITQLGQFITPGFRVPRLEKMRSAQGRNHGLFRAGMKWCGLPRNWDNLGAVYPYLTDLNKNLIVRLPLREVEGIAKSVVKISSKNLATGQTQARFSQIQAARGRKGGRISGAKRHQGSNEQEQPWEAEGVSRWTWYDRQKRTPRESLEQRRPWEVEGVSRATWFRQSGQTQESLEQRRPWEAEGVSRATWYRRKRRETNLRLKTTLEA